MKTFKTSKALRKNSTKLEEMTKKPVKQKIFRKFFRKQCQFYKESGEQCRARTAGKGNFCVTHTIHAGSGTIHMDTVPAESTLSTLANKYDPIAHPVQYIQLSGSGYNMAEIAHAFNVSIESIKNWAAKFPMFHEAVEIGKAALESWYLKTGKDNLDNRFFQTNLYKFITMNNGLNWSDKAESRSQVQGQFGVLLVPNQMGIDEWEQANTKTIDQE